MRGLDCGEKIEQSIIIIAGLNILNEGKEHSVDIWLDPFPRKYYEHDDTVNNVSNILTDSPFCFGTTRASQFWPSVMHITL